MAAATPDFRDRHFPDGVTAAQLAETPVLRFSPRDRLQVHRTEKVVERPVEGPTLWAPSTQGFLDFTLASVGWSLTPERLAALLIASGRLVDLAADVIVDACDTHPLDRTHTTVANGFLHCGAQAVLATVLPVPESAIFGDLMNGRARAHWPGILSPKPADPALDLDFQSAVRQIEARLCEDVILSSAR